MVESALEKRTVMVRFHFRQFHNFSYSKRSNFLNKVELQKRFKKPKSQYQLLVGFEQMFGVDTEYKEKLAPLFFACTILTKDDLLILYYESIYKTKKTH
jgi:hypothetical protein